MAYLSLEKNHNMKSIYLLLVSTLVFFSCNSNQSDQRNTTQNHKSTSVDSSLQDTLTPLKEVEYKPDYDTLLWTDIAHMDSSIFIDMRYATTNNFVEEVMYPCGRCFLRPKAAKSLQLIQDSLKKNGLGIRVFDCYRPLDVQWKLWNKVPDRRYVADPRKGSQHNKGVAVDMTIVDLSTGKDLDMGTDYDYFGGEAWHRATIGFKEPIKSNRLLILSIMQHFGWKKTNSEWWHYSFPMSRKDAPIDSLIWNCPSL